MNNDQEGGLDNQSGSFKEITKVQSERRRAQDFDDLHNEMSGSNVGRIPRFLSEEARVLLQEKRNGKSSRRMSALDMMLLNDPVYAQAYNDTMDFLGRAERIAEQGLSKLETQLVNAEADLKSTLDSAATLPDGRKVFRDIDGKVWDEDQNPVDQATADKIEGRESEPTNETYLKQKKQVQDLKESIHEIRVYQTDVLGSAREELMDRNNPVSKERMDDLKETMKEFAPSSLRSEINQLENSAAPERTPTSEIALATPNLDG